MSIGIITTGAATAYLQRTDLYTKLGVLGPGQTVRVPATLWEGSSTVQVVANTGDDKALAVNLLARTFGRLAGGGIDGMNEWVAAVTSSPGAVLMQEFKRELTSVATGKASKIAFLRAASAILTKFTLNSTNRTWLLAGIRRWGLGRTISIAQADISIAQAFGAYAAIPSRSQRVTLHAQRTVNAPPPTAPGSDGCTAPPEIYNIAVDPTKFESGPSALFWLTYSMNLHSGTGSITAHLVGPGWDKVLSLGAARDTTGGGETLAYPAPNGWPSGVSLNVEVQVTTACGTATGAIVVTFPPAPTFKP